MSAPRVSVNVEIHYSEAEKKSERLSYTFTLNVRKYIERGEGKGEWIHLKFFSDELTEIRKGLELFDKIIEEHG